MVITAPSQLSITSTPSRAFTPTRSQFVSGVGGDLVTLKREEAERFGGVLTGLAGMLNGTAHGAGDSAVRRKKLVELEEAMAQTELKGKSRSTSARAACPLFADLVPRAPAPRGGARMRPQSSGGALSSRRPVMPATPRGTPDPQRSLEVGQAKAVMDHKDFRILCQLIGSKMALKHNSAHQCFLFRGAERGLLSNAEVHQFFRSFNLSDECCEGFFNAMKQQCGSSGEAVIGFNDMRKTLAPYMQPSLERGPRGRKKRGRGGALPHGDGRNTRNAYSGTSAKASHWEAIEGAYDSVQVSCCKGPEQQLIGGTDMDFQTPCEQNAQREFLDTEIVQIMQQIGQKAQQKHRYVKDLYLDMNRTANGHVTRNEVADFFESVGLQSSMGERVFDIVDQDASGAIGYQEFWDLFGPYVQPGCDGFGPTIAERATLFKDHHERAHFTCFNQSTGDFSDYRPPSSSGSFSAVVAPCMNAEGNCRKDATQAPREMRFFEKNAGRPMTARSHRRGPVPGAGAVKEGVRPRSACSLSLAARHRNPEVRSPEGSPVASVPHPQIQHEAPSRTPVVDSKFLSKIRDITKMDSSHKGAQADNQDAATATAAAASLKAALQCASPRDLKGALSGLSDGDLKKILSAVTWGRDGVDQIPLSAVHLPDRRIHISK